MSTVPTSYAPILWDSDVQKTQGAQGHGASTGNGSGMQSDAKPLWKRRRGNGGRKERIQKRFQSIQTHFLNLNRLIQFWLIISDEFKEMSQRMIET